MYICTFTTISHFMYRLRHIIYFIIISYCVFRRELLSTLVCSAFVNGLSSLQGLQARVCTWWVCANPQHSATVLRIHPAKQCSPPRIYERQTKVHSFKAGGSHSSIEGQRWFDCWKDCFRRWDTGLILFDFLLWSHSAFHLGDSWFTVHDK